MIERGGGMRIFCIALFQLPELPCTQRVKFRSASQQNRANKTVLISKMMLNRVVVYLPCSQNDLPQRDFLHAGRTLARDLGIGSTSSVG